ncbi:MAG: hypothetical protein HQL99_01820 [Magnetococcales bacterium]|nr:hypothetical protein [Magnetococcales bacterium]
MIGNAAAMGSSVVEVPLWWRKINAVEFEAVVRARRGKQVPPVLQPGLGLEIRTLLDAEQSRDADEGFFGSIARKWRLVALETFNAKLNRLVERAYSGQDTFQPHPLQWHESGEGLTFWVSEGDVGVGDCIELRFSLFPEQPVPVHAYCRVRRVRREWSGSGLRVECSFATLEDSDAVAPPPPGDAEAPGLIMPPLVRTPPDPDLSERRPPARSMDESASRPVESSRPVVEDRKSRLEQTLAAGRAMLDADPRVVAAHVTPPAHPPPFHSTLPRATPAPSVAVPTQQAGSKRQDFRINDNLPLTWKVVSQKTFDQAVAYFEGHREFPPRERVVRQKRLLAEVDVQLKLLRQLNVKARRPVVWFREFLDRRFRQANAENEEEYFQSVLMLFFGLVKDLTKRPPGSMTAAQVVSLIKEQVDLQIARDHAEPGAPPLSRNKVDEGLTEIARQMGKLLRELRGVSAELADRIEAFREVLALMDLSTQDLPKQLTAEGDAVFTVNLSATGVAWKTWKDRVYRGDLVEVRLGVDPNGDGLEPIWAYGRVVVVQEPDDQGKRRVASYFEHMSPLHREKLQSHMVRKQRSELMRRAGAAL